MWRRNGTSNRAAYGAIGRLERCRLPGLGNPAISRTRFVPATGQVAALRPSLELARLRVRQNKELVASGAGDRFALEQTEANVTELVGQLATAMANEAQVEQKLSGQVDGEQASVAVARAELATAKAQVELRTAEQKQAVAAYAQIGLRAFNEVESALSSEFTAREREAILERAITQNQRALTLEETRYRVGSSDMRAVTQQSLALYASQMSLLRVRSEQLVQRTNAYLALGGGFES